MADLVDRQEFIKGQCNSCDGWCEDVNCDCLNCKADCRCDFIKDLADVPAVDAVEVVRCGECRYCDTPECPMSGTKGRVSASDYCSYGERREENDCVQMDAQRDMRQRRLPHEG